MYLVAKTRAIEKDERWWIVWDFKQAVAIARRSDMNIYDIEIGGEVDEAEWDECELDILEAK